MQPDPDQIISPDWDAFPIRFHILRVPKRSPLPLLPIRLRTMSLCLPPPASASEPISDSESNLTSSESDDENDQTWDDWVSDSNAQQNCKSLFDENVFPSATEALSHDKVAHQFDLDDVSKSLCKCTFAVCATFYSCSAQPWTFMGVFA